MFLPGGLCTWSHVLSRGVSSLSRGSQSGGWGICGGVRGLFHEGTTWNQERRAVCIKLECILVYFGKPFCKYLLSYFRKVWRMVLFVHQSLLEIIGNSAGQSSTRKLIYRNDNIWVFPILKYKLHLLQLVKQQKIQNPNSCSPIDRFLEITSIFIK